MVPEWDPYFRKIESTNNMKQIKVPSHFGAFRCWFAEVDLADEVHGHPWSGRGRLDDCHPWNHTRNTDTWTRGCSHHFLECVPLWGIWYRQGFSFTLERKLINDLTEIFIELSGAGKNILPFKLIIIREKFLWNWLWEKFYKEKLENSLNYQGKVS